VPLHSAGQVTHRLAYRFSLDLLFLLPRTTTSNINSKINTPLHSKHQAANSEHGQPQGACRLPHGYLPHPGRCHSCSFKPYLYLLDETSTLSPPTSPTSAQTSPASPTTASRVTGITLRPSTTPARRSSPTSPDFSASAARPTTRTTISNCLSSARFGAILYRTACQTYAQPQSAFA